jgi:hypothetical protein
VSAGYRVLDDLHAALIKYVVLPSPEAADAVVLWIAATHAQPAWEHAPRLVLSSPEKRCGKSRCLDVVAETSHRPLITVNASVAAVVRSLGDDPPTLLVDEADTIFGTKRQAENNEDLRGILNAGHQRNRPMIRWDITTRSREELPTFGMACLAAIGELPDTIMDRAVVVRMRRRAPGEQVAPYRTRRDGPGLHALRERLAAWVGEVSDYLTDAAPDMPVEDRAADTWEPLVAVADEADGDWPDRARKAAEVMTAAETERDDDGSTGVRLLADLRSIFGNANGLRTDTILERLCELDEAPWGDWYGRRLDARTLAKLLRRYGVKSRDVREDGTGPNRKGYYRADLHTHWVRYVRDKGDSAGQSRRGHVADEGDTCATGATSDDADVADVADLLCERCRQPADRLILGRCPRCAYTT